MSSRVTRHFVTIDGARQIHYRRSGSGPPILVLHHSPSSSREMGGAIALLAEHFTVIAPDTPGNGQSDPLPIDCPEMEDFADNVAALLDALGLDDPVPVYGYHTGGVCALSLVGRHPHRVSLAVMNGYVQLDEAERTWFLDNYMVPFVPDWGGAHLTWAWSRFRDQYIFFPWFARDAAHRLKTSLPSAHYIHDAIMEMMRAGDNYRRSYRTAFSIDTEKALEAVGAPLAIFSSMTDLLAPYLERMPPLPPLVEVHRHPDPPSTQRAAADLLAARTPRGPTPALAGTLPVPGRLWSRFVDVDGTQNLVRQCDEGEGRRVVFVHDLSQSSASIERLMAPLVGRRPVIAIDLLGNGESDWPLGAKEPVLPAQLRALQAVLRDLAVDRVDLVSEGAGCVIAAELVRVDSALVASLTLVAPRMPGHRGGEAEIAAEAASLEPDLAGGHWLTAWHDQRDRAIFSPSHLRRCEDSLVVDPADLDPAQLQAQTVDRFKAAIVHERAVREAAAFPLAEALAQTRCPVHLIRDRHALGELVAQAVGARLSQDTKSPLDV